MHQEVQAAVWFGLDTGGAGPSQAGKDLADPVMTTTIYPLPSVSVAPWGGQLSLPLIPPHLQHALAVLESSPRPIAKPALSTLL